MTEKQCHLYWSLWRRACAARGWKSGDAAFRHKVHRDLLGHDVSHQHLTNPEFDYLKHAFLLWINPNNIAALIFLEDAKTNGERKRLLYSISQMMTAAYRRHVCVDLFDCADLTKLNNEQLTLLRNTLHNRMHKRETAQRRGGAAGVDPTPAKSPQPRQYTLRLQ